MFHFSCGGGVTFSSDSPVSGFGASSPGEVTHAITLLGAQLTFTVLVGAKRVENRVWAALEAIGAVRSVTAATVRSLLRLSC